MVRDERRELAPGTLVGEWLIGAPRGRGGFGIVYHATHAVTRQKAAIKVLHPELAKLDSVLARFEREIALVRGLAHPNIVKTIDSGELHDGRPYLVMEWLDGDDLAEVVARHGALQTDGVLKILDQVTTALDVVHAASIVHRDVKPRNLVSLGDGRIVLVDFGIAKLLEPAIVLHTETGVRLGTPETMAPEQIVGGVIDARTDIYALGLLVYYLLVGCYPFTADTAAEVERMHVHAPRPRPSARAAIPAAIDGVVMRAMSVRAADRHASARELWEDFARARLGAPTRRVRASAPVVAVRIDVDVDEDVDDKTAIAIDNALIAARDGLRAVGATIAVDLANVLLATAVAGDERANAAIDAIADELARGVRGAAIRVRRREGTADVLLDLASW